jgi:hypothetical protein
MGESSENYIAILTKDPFSHIHGFLNVIESIMFIQSLPASKIDIHGKFRKALNRSIATVMRVDTSMADEFISNVLAIKGVFSGSIILQALLSETYEGSDIDIYFDTSVEGFSMQANAVKLGLNPLDEKGNIQVLVPYYRGIIDVSTHMLRNMRNRCIGLEKEYPMVYNCDNVQLIEMKNAGRVDPHRMAIRGHDITAVMNSYHGDIPSLTVCDPQSVSSKTLISAFWKGDTPTKIANQGEQNRMLKYKKRGFNLVRDHPTTDEFYAHLP